MLHPEMTLAQAIRQVAEASPEREALVCAGSRFTYGRLLADIGRLARGLFALGVRRGERVVTLLPPGPAFVHTFFGVAELGAVIVPLNPQLRRREVVYVLDDAEPAALVTWRPIEPQMLERPAGLRYVILADRREGPGLSLDEVMAAGEALPLPGEAASPNDLVALLYTSGTTGTPKGTMHTHRSLIAPVSASIQLRELWTRRPNLRTARQMARALARYGRRLLRALGRPQTFLATIGWHTISGLEVMLQALLMGDRLVAMPRFHPQEALRLVEQEHVTILVAVPVAYQIMLGLQDFERYDTSSLLICGTGAAPCPPELAHEIQRRFGCALHIGFGATETAGGIAATSVADSEAHQAETVGRPMPGIEVRIVDEQRREVPPGQVGELACRSDSLMLGYYRAPELTAAVIDGEKWYYTGDLAFLDAKGYLHIVGRKKDVIIRAGQNIYPAEIEAFLAAHPKIREAAVVGVPSAVGGESVWAFICLQEGAEMTVQEVLDYCRAELEAYKIPSQVRFRSELPRAEMGKVRKFALRQQALEEMKGGDAP